jgi:iduronate 2-sulfatase
MTSKSALVAVVLVVGSILPRGVSAAAGAPRPPNVLFIAVDDLRPELGCYGEPGIMSPCIDRLAADGVVFQRAYCQYSVCNPSRASVLTGLRPDSTGIFDNHAHFRRHVPDVVTLPQHFKRHGYHTQAFGKIFHGQFEEAYVGRTCDDPPSWTAPHWYGSPQYYFSPEGMEVAREVYARKSRAANVEPGDWRQAFVQGLATEAPDVPDGTLYDGEMTDRAIEALGHLADRPFFLAVGYVKPHLPFVAPRKYWDRYDRGAIELPRPPDAPRAAPAAALHDSPELRGQYTNMKDNPLSPAQMRELRHGYAACVSFVDAQVGRLLAELDRLELRERTIVVLWGDHGWHLGEQSLWGKNTNFEQAARAPLIVSVSGGQAAGSTCAALVELVDIYPTLCELASLPLPPHLEGTSFVALLSEPARPWKSAAFSQIRRGSVEGRSLRTPRHRLTRWYRRAAPEETVAMELYDYAAAPTEVENIADRPEHAGLVRELSARLEAGWRASQPAAID